METHEKAKVEREEDILIAGAMNSAKGDGAGAAFNNFEFDQSTTAAMSKRCRDASEQQVNTTFSDHEDPSDYGFQLFPDKSMHISWRLSHIQQGTEEESID